jgi:hypothetical protein
LNRLIAVCAVLAVAGGAHAYTTGISGYSGKSGMICNDCHSGGKPPTVTLSGPATLAPGELEVYTLKIAADVVSSATMPANLPYSGLDVATSAGTLGTVVQMNPTHILDGEVSHTDKLPRANIVQVMFSLTAPPAGGPLTLYAAGLSADGDGTPAGDAASATTLAVMVSAPPDLAGVDLAGPPPLDLSAPVDALSSATPAARPTVKPDLGPPTDEPRWACDCRVGARAPLDAGPALMLVALAALRLRRRR